MLAKFFVALCLAACSVATSAQAVYAPALTPAAVSVGASTTVRVSAVLARNVVGWDSVVVERVGASTKGSAPLAMLRDDGGPGDLLANDGVYSGTFSLNEAQVGRVMIRVAARQAGGRLSARSVPVAVEVLPAGVPTVPVAPDLQALAADPATGAVMVANRVNACFRAETTVQRVYELAQAVGASVVGRFSQLGSCYQLSLPPPAGFAAIQVTILSLSAFSEFNGAAPDHVRAISLAPCSTPLLPTCGTPSYQRLDLDRAHDIATGANVTVAVLDTGVDIAHPTLNPAGSRVIAGPDVSVSPTVQNNTVDPHGHGTHVAGIVAATAPSSKIYAVKVVSVTNGVASGPSESASAEGIFEAVAAGASVINMSYAGRLNSVGSELIEALAVAYARLAGRVLVGAAGNTGSDIKEYPAALPGVISVGNVDTNDLRNPSSNHGPWVQIAAPGTAVNSTFPGGGQTSMTGTSQSAPFVSGTAALLLSMSPQPSSSDVIDRLFSSAVPIGLANQNQLTLRLDPVAALGSMRITRSTAVGAPGASIPRTVDVTLSSTTGVVYSTSLTFLGQNPGCQAFATHPCIQNLPFNFSALQPGAYQLRLRFTDPSASFFGSVELTAPRLSFGTVLGGTATIAHPKNLSFSLFGFGVNTVTVTFQKQ